MITVSDFARRAYNAYVAAGMTPAGACGLIGNQHAESAGFVANRVEFLLLRRLEEDGKTYTDASYTAAVDTGKINRKGFLYPRGGGLQYGYGLSQWTSPERKAALYDLAKQRGVSIGDEQLAIDYTLSELAACYPAVLQVLKAAGTVKEASDYVLVHYESPADCGASVKAGRAAYGQQYFDALAGMEGGDAKMGVRMSNCGHDENGKYTGGKAGDQTGTEWYLRAWYSYPWNYIIRWKDAALANLFADLAVEAAQNNLIGYDQWQRDTFWQHLKASAYRPAKITVACEADCSSGTIALIKAVGYLKGIKELQQCNATYTGNMMAYFQSVAGKKYFEVLTGKYLTDSSYARRGDINLNTAHHVNITVDNGVKAGNTCSTGSGGNAAGSVESLGSTSASGTTLNTKPRWVGAVTVDSLNVRTYAGTEYPNIKSWPVLGKGNLIDVCDTVKAVDGDAWYYVRIDGKYYGFVHSKYIKKA